MRRGRVFGAIEKMLRDAERISLRCGEQDNPLERQTLLKVDIASGAVLVDNTAALWSGELSGCRTFKRPPVKKAAKTTRRRGITMPADLINRKQDPWYRASKITSYTLTKEVPR